MSKMDICLKRDSIALLSPEYLHTSYAISVTWNEVHMMLLPGQNSGRVMQLLRRFKHEVQLFLGHGLITSSLILCLRLSIPSFTTEKLHII